VDENCQTNLDDRRTILRTSILPQVTTRTVFITTLGKHRVSQPASDACLLMSLLRLERHESSVLMRLLRLRRLWGTAEIGIGCTRNAQVIGSSPIAGSIVSAIDAGFRTFHSRDSSKKAILCTVVYYG